ncbi:MAG TPA: hypothetical protein VN883_06320 [Myxococcales bacterium]|nr:hypothetical protein [Myxococcales bacterium]
MNLPALEQIARAVLYEGFLLYPYRPSAAKNRRRWTFGALYPPAFHRENGDACAMQTECLVRGSPTARVEVRVRFLHLQPEARAQPEAGSLPEAAQDAVEREVAVPELALQRLIAAPARIDFSFPAPAPAPGGAPVRGRIDVRCEALPGELFRLAVAIENEAALDDARDREAALLRAFVSTHTLLGVREGEFVSLLEPPEAARGAAAACRNVGTWPVLVGKAGARDAMLSSPIILYDYPAIAEQSPGDLFDSTEIDEILSLRILTLTDEEKRQMREAHPRARALLERTEALTPEQLMALHGTLRSLEPQPDDGPPWDDPHPAKDARALSGGKDLLPGHRVRLRPRPGGDVFDLLLAGKTATIGSIEQDYEGHVFLSLTIDDDPGQDLGAQGKPGHRFFFRPEEVEPLGQGEADP